MYDLQERLAQVSARLASLTSTNRVRVADAQRNARNGNSADLEAKLEGTVTDLEKIADDLEKAIR